MATVDVTTKPEFKQVKIEDIQVGRRYRRDVGDLKPLASSIRKVGLLHPIVVDEDNLKLIAGYRRLKACQDVLKWDTIPAHIVSLRDLVFGEYAENTFRKDFTPSEMAAIARALGIKEKQAARERRGRPGRPRGGKLPAQEKGRVRDKIAEIVGTSGRTLEKATAVVEAAEKNPEFQPLVEEMDETGNVDAAYKKLQETTEPARPRAPELIEIDLHPRSLPARLGMTGKELLGAGAAITALLDHINMTVDEFLAFTKSKLPDIEPLFREAGCSGSDEVIKVTVRKRQSAALMPAAEEGVDPAPDDQAFANQVPVNRDDFINLP